MQHQSNVNSLQSTFKGAAVPESGQRSALRLFRHTKRPNWGVAALVWERNGKRGYQFSDGKLRVFKEGYYTLFESAVVEQGGEAARAMIRLTNQRRSEGTNDTTNQLSTLRDQIELFRREYPTGFVGTTWTKKYRGTGARRRLKRHRDPALAEAAQLGQNELRTLIAAEQWGLVLDVVVALLSGTNLVPAGQLRKLRALSPSRELVFAISRWLHGEHADEREANKRFDRLVRELGDAGTWEIVTALGGLVHPKAHTCVRLSVYSTQGKMLMSGLRVQRRPRGKDYHRLLEVARTVQAELEGQGFAPRDLLDVYDFVWETLRPAARETLLAIPRIRLAEARQASEADSPAERAA